MKNNMMLNKHLGCLLGGAAGDALGYAVEFKSYRTILKEYGQKGIREYQLTNDVALISDDTQMTLFTADALLQAEAKGIHSKNDYIEAMIIGYSNWYRTQFESYDNALRSNSGSYKAKGSWLLGIKELYNQRAPGVTCMQEIENGCRGNMENPINESKGCGGLIRIAPIGLYFCSPVYAAKIASENAALTHGHPLGYIPAAALAYLISLLCSKPELCLKEAVRETLREIDSLFKNNRYLDSFLEIVVKAVYLSKEDRPDEECIREIGEGWTAEETLAIAIYCALKYEKDFDAAIIAAVNHDGDSDSTGTVVGNILGVYLGYEAIPKRFLQKLELKKTIWLLAEDLLNSEPYPKDEEKMAVWKAKYIEHCYRV